MSVSLDGYIESIQGDLNWAFPDAEIHRHFNELERHFDISFYGRRLYENMAAFWPTADENPNSTDYEIEFARIWKEQKKIVFSKTLSQVGWNSTLFKGDIGEEVKRLKAQPGRDMSVGGANLAATFMHLDLIDEYRLYIRPVILGGGKRMFPALDQKIKLVLTENYTFGSGVVLLAFVNKSAT